MKSKYDWELKLTDAERDAVRSLKRHLKQSATRADKCRRELHRIKSRAVQRIIRGQNGTLSHN